ncbi:Efflux pump periplasmic linker BepF [Rosistilla carotiformis]|uniref:Efflux pump periplasmic linker BepF n=1 Tax=Rosistilla carotiformis TaxID=2528017 RepID=A0A518JXW4_9BACT|nr:efflux RND transporter periplasmic adaptor subunit [Rosistilla carotiformis]QDV70376.1 Efflux pump periplasmic linker BepF [Rosistilla carotiformis]
MSFPRSKSMWLLMAGLVSGVAIFVAANAWSGDSQASGDAASKIVIATGSRPLPVTVLSLGELSAPPRVDDYRGTIEASKEAELAFRRSGRVFSVAVEEGDVVRRGQTLAQLEVDDLAAIIEATQARIDEAEAMLAELEAGPRAETIAAAAAEVSRLSAAVKLAQITTQRELELQRSNSSSIQTYDNARFQALQQEAALEAATQQYNELKAGTRSEQLVAQRARVAMLQAELKGYQVDLRDGRIVAPFDGVVGRRYLDEGTIAGPDRVVLRVLQTDPLEARFGVSPEDVRGLAPGQPVTVTLGEAAIQAEIGRIEPELDRSTRTQAVLVKIPRQQPRPDGSYADGIVPGRTASLSLGAVRNGGADSYWVPITSLARSTRGLWSLMAVVEGPAGQSIVQRRDVQVLETDTRLARISGGMIAAGDRVVAAGLHRLTPGMAVAPVDREALRQVESLSLN